MQYIQNILRITNVDTLVMEIEIEEFEVHSDLFPDVPLHVNISSRMPGKNLTCSFLIAPLDPSGQPDFTGGGATSVPEALRDGLKNFLVEARYYGAKEEKDFYWGDFDEDF
ncbi:MAG: hypothetical protein H0V70_05835 [Ktedonobacteraceae bacterium]|nr:hypothetical protein [Ktedonobacteraceae bacterium]